MTYFSCLFVICLFIIYFKLKFKQEKVAFKSLLLIFPEFCTIFMDSSPRGASAVQI